MSCHYALLYGQFYACSSPLTFSKRDGALEPVNCMETHMGKNQRWFTYPHLVITRIPSGLRLSPVITWKFDISIVQLYYTTLMAAKPSSASSASSTLTGSFPLRRRICRYLMI